MKQIFFVFLSITLNFLYSQETIIVLDNNTKQPISFVAISFDNDNGFYTNSNGSFSLKEVKGEVLFLSCLGYKSKSIILDTIKDNIIYLEPDNIQLNEVILSNKKSKFKKKKIKSIKHNDFLNAQIISIGVEFASFLPNKYSEKEVQIKKIIIPVVTKTISFSKDLIGKNQTVKKLPFSTIYKINIYENNNGLPGQELLYENITCLFNEKSNTFEIDIDKYNIYLPKEGLYVGLLNLGLADETGELIPTTPYIEKTNKDGVVIKIGKSVKPYFPVNIIKDYSQTFFRETFDENKKWKILSKNNLPKDKSHNINFGYELKIYE